MYYLGFTDGRAFERYLDYDSAQERARQLEKQYPMRCIQIEDAEGNSLYKSPSHEE